MEKKYFFNFKTLNLLDLIFFDKLGESREKSSIFDDFRLFDYVNQRIDDYTSSESFVKQINKIVKDIPKEECQKTLNKWIERMELCKKKIKETILNI